MIARLRPGCLVRYFDRAGLLAISSGAMIALSFPNPDLSFLVWIALIPLLIALEESSPQVAFRIGMTCGITAYAFILYWLNIVFTQYGHLPWSVSVLVYLLLVRPEYLPSPPG
jgi:apolipoprotein N-acyltransferase